MNHNRRIAHIFLCEKYIILYVDLLINDHNMDIIIIRIFIADSYLISKRKLLNACSIVLPYR